MTPPPILKRHLSDVRRRLILDALAISAPVVILCGVAAWSIAGPAACVVAAVLAAALLAALARQRIGAFDGRWLAAVLDARAPRMEDSSALLFQDPATLSGLAALQRRRLESRLAEVETLDPRPDWSRRRIAVAWAALAAVLLAMLFWPAARPQAPLAPPQDAVAAPRGSPRITGQRLRVVPPAYTGLPSQTLDTLDAEVPQGSRIEWSLDVTPRPDALWAQPSEGARLDFTRRRDRWSAVRVADQSFLYRIEAEGMARQRLHRIEAVADAAPTVQLIDPDSQLVLMTAGQQRWTVVFEAGDDYGVAATAELRVIVTQGQGESITYEQRSVALRGVGEARRKRFTATLDPAREGLNEAGDLIVQLIVRDNRNPGPQRTEGPSVILRRPDDLGLADGLDGMMQTVMPAYFASQRQIIIDAEALVAERGDIATDRFMERSNSLGVDQARLRLRYGQFMGEETEGGGSEGGIALPTNDAPALPTNEAPAAAAPAPEETHHADDGHDHGDATTSPGAPLDVAREYGHVHDDSDASTLFDPGTRSTLALALDAMWSSERALRQGRPEEALPFAFEALEFLKEAQQATRIFLGRTGSDLPPVDMSRRLTGDRDDIVADLPPTPRRRMDPVLAEAWRALEDRPGAAAESRPRLDALDRWIRANGARLDDPLALSVAIDAVRGEPDCAECRRTLRGLLWRALETPPAGVNRRAAPTRRGQTYLDGLR